MLTRFCVYTIRHSKDLKAIAQAGGSGGFKENKAWVSADRLLREARLKGERLPILFAPAEGTRYLFAWALLEKINITADGKTKYTFTALKLFDGKLRRKSVLKKKSNLEPLAENFIRPYAVCWRPKFLI